MALRYDVGSLRPPVRLADGRLRADAVFTRTGVFTYRNPDGTERREYRPATEVFRGDALATFADAPLTDDHPPAMINATNAKQYAVGHVSGEPRRDGDKVVGRIVVDDAATIVKLEGGKVSLSCGYECDLDTTPGVTPEGERYDAIQMNIRGNHVAIVDSGRAGPDARVRMDSALMISGGEPTMNTHKDTKIMDELLKQLTAANGRADAAEAKASTLEARAIAAEASATAEKTRADAAEKARTDAITAEPARIRARVELESVAAKSLGADFKADAADRDLMVAVVKRLDSFDVPADASAEAVTLCYRNAVARADKAGAALANVRVAAEASRNDAPASDEAGARARMMAYNQSLSQSKE